MEIGIACPKIIQRQRNSPFLQSVAEPDQISVGLQKAALRQFDHNPIRSQLMPVESLYDFLKDIAL